jgi:N-formylglutamate deformylase
MSSCAARVRSPYFEVRPPSSPLSLPLVVHVPHASTEIPPKYRASLAVNDRGLATELRLMTDRYTDELGAAATELGATMFVNRVSRLVMDPERFPDDSDEPMARNGMGAVHVSRQDGSPLRRFDFTAEERETLMTFLYRPYHRSLEEVVARRLEASGCCLIVDLHSYPRKPFPYEDPGLARPAVCVGFDDFHGDATLFGRWFGRIREAGLDVAVNTPCAGSLVPARFFGRDARVRSLMIELRRDLYMDEATGAKSAGFEDTRSLVKTLLALAAERCGELIRDHEK